MPDFDEYDHDFETPEQCANCEEFHDDCTCDSFEPEEVDGLDECNQCGLPEDDPTHVSGE